jgi:hypothetical protein
MFMQGVLIAQLNLFTTVIAKRLHIPTTELGVKIVLTFMRTAVPHDECQRTTPLLLRLIDAVMRSGVEDNYFDKVFANDAVLKLVPTKTDKITKFCTLFIELVLSRLYLVNSIRKQHKLVDLILKMEYPDECGDVMNRFLKRMQDTIFENMKPSTIWFLMPT